MILLSEQQQKEQLTKKLQQFREGLEKLQNDTGLTIIPMIFIDGKFPTQRTEVDGHVLEARAQVAPFTPQVNAVAEKIIQEAKPVKKEKA